MLSIPAIGTSGHAQQTPWANKLDEAKAARDELLKKEVAGLRELVEAKLGGPPAPPAEVDVPPWLWRTLARGLTSIGRQ